MADQLPRAGIPTDRERTPFGTVEFRSHTADLTVELRGHSASDLFRLAAWALARVQVLEWPDSISVEEHIELDSDGWDDLIVNWINQLIFVSERHRAIWTEVDFVHLAETHLEARVKGRTWPDRPDALGREVKAASYFGLDLVPGPSLWLARITLDL
jgi:SHS2 domain-containing protein